MEGYCEAGVAEVVGEAAVGYGAGYDHAAYAEGGEGLGGGAAGLAVLDEAAFEDADHSLENLFEGLTGAGVAAGDVGGQGYHGAGIFHVFQVLAGEIGADDLRADVGGGEVDVDSFPAIFPFGVGEEAAEDFGVEITFAVEITVEAAVGEAGTRHDLADGDIFKAVAVEEFSRAFDDGLFDGGAVAGWVRHGALLNACGESMARIIVAAKENIILNIFWGGDFMGQLENGIKA